MNANAPHLIYFADPMCSWCWGFAPVIAAIQAQFGESLPIRLVLGGLRPGTTERLTQARRATLAEHWHHVHEASGQPFSAAFFDRDGFVYDTDPACRAVVVLRRAGMELALQGLHRLQRAFYAENRDITQDDELAAVAAELGQDAASFRAALGAPETRTETLRDYAISQRTGVTGFPTLIAGTGQSQEYAMVTQGFQRGDIIVPALQAWLRRHTQPGTPG
jgi:putative protein-disulfide isomerase